MRLLTRPFRSSVLCGRQECLLVRPLTFLTFEVYTYINVNVKSLFQIYILHILGHNVELQAHAAIITPCMAFRED